MKCACCGRGASDIEHYATLDRRCRLDDETWKALEKELDLSGRALAADERDVYGNAVVCMRCTDGLLVKVKEKVREAKRRR